VTALLTPAILYGILLPLAVIGGAALAVRLSGRDDGGEE
jgi:hypothetical protein